MNMPNFFNALFFFLLPFTVLANQAQVVSGIPYQPFTDANYRNVLYASVKAATDQSDSANFNRSIAIEKIQSVAELGLLSDWIVCAISYCKLPRKSDLSEDEKSLIHRLSAIHLYWRNEITAMTSSNKAWETEGAAFLDFINRAYANATNLEHYLQLMKAFDDGVKQKLVKAKKGDISVAFYHHVPNHLLVAQLYWRFIDKVAIQNGYDPRFDPGR